MAFTSNVGGRGDEFVLSGCKHTRDWVTEYMKGVGIDSYNIALPEELVDVDPQQLAAYIYAHGNGNMLFTIGNDRKSSKLLAPDLDEVQRTIDFLKELAQKEDPLAYITDWNGWAIACDEPVYTPAAERPPCILSEQVKDRVQRAYVQQGFEKAYGPIDHFARRHLVYNDAQGKISESLIQEPGSKLIKGLKNHVILIATNVEHASHFVQVLRQADVDQVHDIVIFANHIGDHEAHKVLSLFRGVYLINSETTAKNTDNGFLSRKSLIKLSVEAAHAVVITAAKCKDEDEAATHDLNHMCLRMVIMDCAAYVLCDRGVSAAGWQAEPNSNHYSRGATILHACLSHPHTQLSSSNLLNSNMVSLTLCGRPIISKTCAMLSKATKIAMHGRNLKSLVQNRIHS